MRDLASLIAGFVIARLTVDAQTAQSDRELIGIFARYRTLRS
jgi:hypothetical protein